MADNFILQSAMDTAGFIPQEWAQGALEVFKGNVGVARLIAHDSDYTQPGFRGKSLTIPYPGTFVVTKKTDGVGVGLTSPIGGTSATVTLNNHATVDFELPDFASVTGNASAKQRYIDAAGIALAQQVDTDVLIALGGLTIGTGDTGSAVTGAMIRTVKGLMDTAKIPQTDRFLVVTADDHVALLNDTDLKSYFAYQSGQAYRDGSLGRVYGFDVFMSQFVKNATFNYNVAAHKDAAVLVWRPFDAIPAGAGVIVSQVYDQDLQMGIRMTIGYDQANHGIRVNMDCLYGVAKVREAGYVIRS